MELAVERHGEAVIQSVLHLLVKDQSRLRLDSNNMGSFAKISCLRRLASPTSSGAEIYHGFFREIEEGTCLEKFASEEHIYPVRREDRRIAP